jgi:predicted AlkP superfamily pyrophosphatase or phosphodiesterase
MKRTIYTALFAVLTLTLSAQSRSTTQSETPKLVVGITIEHFRADYINRYWDTFQNGGFKRLYSHGAVFDNARLDIHNLKPATTLATLYTGTYPSEHGIIADKWFKQLTSEEVDAVKSNSFLTLGSDSKEGNVSAQNLKTTTIGDVLKQQTNNKAKVYSVALNAKSAVLTAGHSADGAFWFDKTNGNMISSSYYIDKFPDWVVSFNQKNLCADYITREWDLLLPIGSYTAGFDDDNSYEKGFSEKWNTFPYNVKNMSEKLEFPYELLKAVPWGNRLINEFALELIAQENLGEDDVPDLLNLTFSALDYANKDFHPSSVEMQETFLRIDQEISNILTSLDKTMGKDNYLVFLTSASNVSYPVGILNEKFNLNAGEFSPQNAMALLRMYLNVLYGVGEWIQMYNEEQIYLNHDLIEKKEKDLNEMTHKVALFINQVAGVKAAVPAYEIETNNMSNQRFKTLENSYCVKRSGDVMLLLEEGWQPTYRYHKVDYTTENRLPLVLYGAQVKPGKYYQTVDIIDLVPTLAQFLQIFSPDDAHGKILEPVFW